MRVARRTVLASALASLAAPGRDAAGASRRAAHRAEAAPRVLGGVERARQVPRAMGAQGRGGVERPHSHRYCFHRWSSAARRRNYSIRPATVTPISSGPCPGLIPAAFPTSKTFELPFLPSSPRAGQFQGAAGLLRALSERRIRRNSSALLFLCRSQRHPRLWAGAFDRGYQKSETSCANAPCRRGDARARGGSGADARRGTAGGAYGGRRRRLCRPLAHGADVPAQRSFSKSTPSSPTCRCRAGPTCWR